MPFYPLNEDKGHNYDVTTYWENLVREYTGLNIIEVNQLNYIDYLVFRRDAFIHKLSQTEKGQEYLDNAYRLEQTEPDKQNLRNQFGEEG